MILAYLYPVRDTMNIEERSLSDLIPSQWNVRKVIGDITALTASIKKDGVIEPLIVRKSTDRRAVYEVVSGARRLAAAKAAETVYKVHVIVREMTNAEANEISMTENLQRGDLTPNEIAEGYLQWSKEVGGGTQEAYAAKVGISQQNLSEIVKSYTLGVELSQNGLNLVPTFRPTEEERKKGGTSPTRMAEIASAKEVFSKALPPEEAKKKTVSLAKVVLEHNPEEQREIIKVIKKNPELSPVEAEKLASGTEPERALRRKKEEEEKDTYTMRLVIPMPIADAMEEFCVDHKIGHETYILSLITRNLKEEGYYGRKKA